MKIFETRIEMINSFLFSGYVGAEIGVLNGDFAEILLTHHPYQLHLIDIWQGITPSGDVDGNNFKYYNMDECYANVVNRFKNNKSVFVHKKSSQSFLQECDDNSMDFIYLDASHTFDDVYNDLHSSWNKIKKGGYLTGHDFALTDKCNNSWEFGVEQAVYQFCRDINCSIYALANDGCMSFAIKK